MATKSEPTASDDSHNGVEIARLLQAGRIEEMGRFFRGPWVVVRCSGAQSDGLFVFACLIPLTGKTTFLQHLGWDFRSDDLQPRVECVSHGSGEREVYYLQHGNERGAEALFHGRSHSNQWPVSIEVAEEFRLFFNLHHDRSREVLLHCDVNGTEEEVARIRENMLELKIAYLVRYLRAKQMLSSWATPPRPTRWPNWASNPMHESRRVTITTFSFRWPTGIMATSFDQFRA